MVHIFLVLVFSLFALPSFAQEAPKIQGKTVLHAPVPADPGWFLTGWNVTNIRQDATDNTNIMFGVGRKLANGWVEFMAQRQYSFASNQWFADFRLSSRLADRLNLFVEIAPFLERKALYEFFRFDYRVGKVNLVLESENIHREGPDMWGVGPGVGIPAFKLVGRVMFAPVVTWQMRPNDPDFVRFYIAFPLK